jgi:UPF0716 protein FxsA
MLARLFLLFITVPALELLIFLMVGQRIGIGATFAIILITGFFGAYLAKSQGLKALARYQASLAEGVLPHEAIIDSLLILIAGILLLIPGFLTDSIGFSLLVPSIREWVRARLEKSIRDKITVAGQAMGVDPRRSGSQPRVITVESEIVETSTERASWQPTPTSPPAAKRSLRSRTASTARVRPSARSSTNCWH